MKTVPKAAQATTPEVIPFTFTGQSSPKSNQGTVPTPKPKNKMYKIISIKGKTGRINWRPSSRMVLNIEIKMKLLKH